MALATAAAANGARRILPSDFAVDLFKATPGEHASFATFWGTGQEHFDATTVDDTARYAARVAADPDVPAGKFAAAAQQLRLDDLVTAFERADSRTYEDPLGRENTHQRICRRGALSCQA